MSANSAVGLSCRFGCFFFYLIVVVIISPVTHVLIIWGEELQLSKESWKYRRAVLLKTLCQTGIKAVSNTLVRWLTYNSSFRGV